MIPVSKLQLQVDIAESIEKEVDIETTNDDNTLTKTNKEK